MLKKYWTPDTSRMGMSAEKRFKQLSESSNLFMRLSTPAEDRREHFDLVLKPPFGRVDVKSRKRISRSDAEPTDDLVWAELKGVNNTPGWLFGGKADYMAFEEADGFLLVPRETMAEHVKDCIKRKFSCTTRDPRMATHKIYSRNNRHDQLILVPRPDLRGLKNACFLQANK